MYMWRESPVEWRSSQKLPAQLANAETEQEREIQQTEGKGGTQASIE